SARAASQPFPDPQGPQTSLLEVLMTGLKWGARGSALWVALLPGHAAHAISAQALQEMRSLGLSVCANIRVYFNENGSPYELRNKRAYLQGMTRLQSLAATAELPQSEVELRSGPASPCCGAEYSAGDSGL